MAKVFTEREAAPEEQAQIDLANEALAIVGLELIGTRPKRDR